MRVKRWRLTIFFCGIWALTILYGEMFAFWVPSLWSCSWPHPKTNAEGNHGDYVKVAVITDPQLTDRTSLPLTPKSLALETVQFYSDLYMRRAFVGSILPFKPDVLLFLGDYFDGGHIMFDEEWEDSLNRFKHIFGLNTPDRINDMKVHYIPGNHDIGYAAHIYNKPEVVKRYEEVFGTRNYKITLGKIDFIAIDGQAIDGYKGRALASLTWEFVKKVPIESNPRVLLTHIPLYRPDQTFCGPHRTLPIIDQRIAFAGYNKEIVYQNYVTEESSNNLLDLIQPVLVLSGHDHDQCSVTHVTKNGPVKEHTVGTVSWQQGNLYPSFMLLSASRNSNANASGSESTVNTQLYIILCGVTILMLLLWPSQGIDVGNYLGAVVVAAKKSASGGGGGMKQKSEDEECEYEMVWDAEGCMHLVKKPLGPPALPLIETGVLDRGNAVMRPTRRQANQEQGESELEGNDVKGRTAALRTGSGRKAVVQRVMRTVGMVSAIALLNVPLYMMLLFKDWAGQIT
ncbi:hypothetical protein V2J09_022593 [Rumex salicifolius]